MPRVKKLVYIANVRLPTEKAHGIQIMEMCSAFVQNGCEVELIVPKKKNAILTDPFVYYDITPNFTITRLWCFDRIRHEKIGFLVESFTFALRVTWWALGQNDIFYTRDAVVALFLKIVSKNVTWESHTGENNTLVRGLLFLKTGLIVISKGLKDFYVNRGIAENRILISPDGVDIDDFNIQKSKTDARKKLGFDQVTRIALYTGHLYSWKGADVLAKAAEYIPEIQVVFVGGMDNDVISFKDKFAHISNIKVVGKKPHRDIPLYMRAADILIIPNSNKEVISRLYTSPLKLFESMASGTPIVASNLPSIREVLDESTGYFAQPDDPKDLARVIDTVFKEYNQACIKASRALEKVSHYSWKERARNIIQFCHDTF